MGSQARIDDWSSWLCREWPWNGGTRAKNSPRKDGRALRSASACQVARLVPLQRCSTERRAEN